MNHSLHVHEYYMYLKKVDCQKLLCHCFTYGNEFSYINFVDSRDFLRLGLFRLMVSSWDEPITIYVVVPLWFLLSVFIFPEYCLWRLLTKILETFSRDVALAE